MIEGRGGNGWELWGSHGPQSPNRAPCCALSQAQSDTAFFVFLLTLASRLVLMTDLQTSSWVLSFLWSVQFVMDFMGKHFECVKFRNA